MIVFNLNSREAMDCEIPIAEMDFCTESRLQCMEQLGQWQDIHSENPRTEWWNIRSSIRHVLCNSGSEQLMAVTAQTLDRLAINNVNPAILADLAAFYFCNKNEDRAAHCATRAIDQLVNHYSQLSPLNFRNRQSLLENLCVATEVSDQIDSIHYLTTTTTTTTTTTSTRSIYSL